LVRGYMKKNNLAQIKRSDHMTRKEVTPSSTS